MSLHIVDVYETRCTGRYVLYNYYLHIRGLYLRCVLNNWYNLDLLVSRAEFLYFTLSTLKTRKTQQSLMSSFSCVSFVPLISCKMQPLQNNISNFIGLKLLQYMQMIKCVKHVNSQSIIFKQLQTLSESMDQSIELTL